MNCVITPTNFNRPHSRSGHWPTPGCISTRALESRRLQIMGNTPSSKDKHIDDTVDLGALTPQGGIYASAQQDWNHAIVAQLIIDRKLAPFYRPLEDYEDDWDDDRILAARKNPDPDANPSLTTGGGHSPGGTSSHGHGSNQNLHASAATASLKHVSSKSASRLNNSKDKEPPRNYEAQLYRGATECPICFMVRLFVFYRFWDVCKRSIDAFNRFSVLPTKHQSYSVLRSSYLHRMFRSN